MVQIFCVKCRKKVEIPNAEVGEIKWTKNGKTQTRQGFHGTCPVCGTKVKQFKKSEHKDEPPAEEKKS